MDSRDLQGLMEAYVKVCAPVDEAVYGGEPEKPKDTRMVVTAADKKGNTKAYQNYKAGHKGYKAADHLGEESVDKAAQHADRAGHSMTFGRKGAGGMPPVKKEELDIFDAILEYLVAEGYAATNKEALVIMANMSEEWRESIIESQYARENPEKYEREQAKKTSKKEKAMNDPHTGINSPAFEKFMRKQMGR